MAERLEGSDMEAREPRREVIEAEGRVLRDGEIANHLIRRKKPRFETRG